MPDLIDLRRFVRPGQDAVLRAGGRAVTVRCELVSRTSLRVDAPVGAFAQATVADGVVGADGVRLAVAFAVRPGAGDRVPGYHELALTHAVVLGERRSERFAAAAGVAVRVHRADVGTTSGERVQLVDVSRNGIAFDAERAYGVGQYLVVRTRATGGLEVPVEVVRTSPHEAATRYGCRVLDAARADDLIRLAGPVAEVR